MKLNGIIMASGFSRRMGRNKLLLDFKGKKIYSYILDLVKKLDLDRVVVVSIYDEIIDAAKAYGFEAVYNPYAEKGKSSSIKLGLIHSLEDSPYMFFVADQPLLTEKTARKLIESYKDSGKVTYPIYKDKRGNPVIFPPSYREELISLEGDVGGMTLVSHDKAVQVEISNGDELLDIDRESDYKELLDKYGK